MKGEKKRMIGSCGKGVRIRWEGRIRSEKRDARGGVAMKRRSTGRDGAVDQREEGTKEREGKERGNNACLEETSCRDPARFFVCLLSSVAKPHRN